MLGPRDLHDRQVRPRLVAEAVGHAGGGGFLLELLAERRIGQHAPVRRLVGRLDGRAPAQERLQRIGMAQRELHAEREAADLRPQLAPASAGRLDLAQLAEHARGIAGIDEHRGDHHRPAVGGRDLLEPGNRGRHALGEHEHAAPGLAQRAGQRHQLALVGQSRGHRHAGLAVVLLERGGREADRARRARPPARCGASRRSRPRSPGAWWRRRRARRCAPRSGRRTRRRSAPRRGAPWRRGTRDSSRSPSARRPAAPPATCPRRGSARAA